MCVRAQSDFMLKKSPLLFQNVLAQLYYDEFDMNAPLKDLFSQTKQSPIEKKNRPII